MLLTKSEEMSSTIVTATITTAAVGNNIIVSTCFPHRALQSFSGITRELNACADLSYGNIKLRESKNKSGKNISRVKRVKNVREERIVKRSELNFYDRRRIRQESGLIDVCKTSTDVAMKENDGALSFNNSIVNDRLTGSDTVLDLSVSQNLCVIQDNLHSHCGNCQTQRSDLTTIDSPLDLSAFAHLKSENSKLTCSSSMDSSERLRHSFEIIRDDSHKFESECALDLSSNSLCNLQGQIANLEDKSSSFTNNVSDHSVFPYSKFDVRKIIEFGRVLDLSLRCSTARQNNVGIDCFEPNSSHSNIEKTVVDIESVIDLSCASKNNTICDENILKSGSVVDDEKVSPTLPHTRISSVPLSGELQVSHCNIFYSSNQTAISESVLFKTSLSDIFVETNAALPETPSINGIFNEISAPTLTTSLNVISYAVPTVTMQSVLSTTHGATVDGRNTMGSTFVAFQVSGCTSPNVTVVNNLTTVDILTCGAVNQTANEVLDKLELSDITATLKKYDYMIEDVSISSTGTDYCLKYEPNVIAKQIFAAPSDKSALANVTQVRRQIAAQDAYVTTNTTAMSVLARVLAELKPNEMKTVSDSCKRRKLAKSKRVVPVVKLEKMDDDDVNRFQSNDTLVHVKTEVASSIVSADNVPCGASRSPVYSCVKCKYSTTAQFKLEQHIRAHSGRLICKACGKVQLVTFIFYFPVYYAVYTTLARITHLQH